MPTYKLICGDSAQVLKTFEPDSIDLTVTSPPYDNLRTYDGYTDFDFETIAQQLYWVTKPGGVVVWVVGDATINGSETGTSFKQALYFMGCGFNLHDTMIYDKKGFRFPFPNRYHQVFEYMFVLSKPGPGSEGPKTFNPLMDRITLWRDNHIGGHKKREADGSITMRSGFTTEAGQKAKRFNIWTYAGSEAQSDDTKIEDHPAIFPEALARDHILSWSNPGDLVLDCFCGSGTTGKMAIKYQRNFVGIEISQKYLDIAERRIKDAAQQPLLFE
jgi:DNA modification methylase